MGDVLFTFDVNATSEGRVAYVWGQVTVQLKRYLETGVPVFVNS